MHPLRIDEIRLATTMSDALHYLESEHSDEAELAAWVRDLVLRADPDLVERVYTGWRGLGYRHPEAGYVFGIFPRAGRVELLFEHGAALADPEGALRGERSQTRVLAIHRADADTARLITLYAQQTIAERLLVRRL